MQMMMEFVAIFTLLSVIDSFISEKECRRDGECVPAAAGGVDNN
jgi:hypothetical protein